ncbi:diaminopimelate decarboxylase, partial [Streptomyces sp. 2MCAF27]
PEDTLARGVPLPDLAPGDVLAVLRSGAYGPTASPGLFLSHGFPAEVLVHEGRPLLVRDRDTADDLLRKQRHHQFVQ